MATFKERFLMLQKEKGISLDEMALILHTNKSSLSRIVNGHLSLKKELLEDMSNYFNCSTDYLLGRTNIRNKEEEIVINNLKKLIGDQSIKSFVDRIGSPGITIEQLEAYMDGEITPSAGSIFIIAEALGIDFKEFYKAESTLNESITEYGTILSKEEKSIIDKIREYKLNVDIVNNMLDLLAAQMKSKQS